MKDSKLKFNTDFYLIIDEVFLNLKDGGLERLTSYEVEQYYNLNYVNRILSVKSEYGEEIPYYWVI